MRKTHPYKRGMMAALRTLWFFLVVILTVIPCFHQAKQKPSLIIRVTDYKEFKKLIRTKTNLLVIFTLSEKETSKSMKMFDDVAEEMKGKATMAYINCSTDKKFCKKLKVSPTTFDLKHYKDGEFNKEYDRKLTFKSMVNFLLDPKGDAPWEEDPAALDVIHLDTEEALNKLLRREKRPLLVMFYAPWCGFCKRLKPDYSAAATELKNDAVLVGIDVDKPHHWNLRLEYNITGFPTLIYFEKGKKKMLYGGETNKEGIISWMKNPQPKKEPTKEGEWSDEESEVVHLDDDTFPDTINKQSSVLVMFYAPWCGHCKKMKPEYTDAAETMKKENIPGVLAAVDATKAKKLGEEYKVKGFPTVKYFKDGQYMFDMNERTKDKIIEFMKDPKEPPPPPPPEPKWEEQESDVVHLTDDTFKTLLRKKKHALVMFYAPWCGHCKKAKPEFMAAASIFKDDAKVSFAALDCTSHAEVCSSNDVTGYPTFKYFNYGKNSQKYMGGREEPDFVNFMKDPLNPTPTPTPPVASPADSWKDIEGHENVHHLTADSFDSFMKEKKSVLVMFYAPWCGHCKAMKPAYSEAATILANDGIDAVIAAVDATVEPSLAAKFEVKGYPTLQYFKNGELAFKYTKGRTVDDLVKFMKDPKAPPPPPPPEKEWSEEATDVHFPTGDELEAFIKKEKSVLVMFYAPWCGHCKSMKPDFAAAATKLKTELPTAKLVAIDATKYKDVGKKYEVKGYPTLKYFENGEEHSKYTSGRTEEKIIAFMKKPTKPEPAWSEEKSDVVFPKSSEFEEFIKKPDKLLVMFYAPWCEYCKTLKPAYMSAATKLKSIPTVTLAAVDTANYKDLARKYEIKGLPTLKYFEKGEEKPNYSGGRTEEKIIAFMKGEETEKKKKSPPPEEDWSTEATDTNFLTPDNFDEFIEKEKSVLVMFYAPWCGHCKKMKPEFFAAATRLKKEEPKAKMAMVDAQKHRELGKRFNVKGFPTLLHFEDGEEKVKYTGARKTEDLIEFMKSSLKPEVEWSTVPSSVKHLTEDNFQEMLRHKEAAVVLYYTACPDCKTIKPEYEQAAEEMKKNKNKIFAAVDCLKQQGLCKGKVDTFPTLKMFVKGKFLTDYDGKRTKDELLNFLKNAPTVSKDEL